MILVLSCAVFLLNLVDEASSASRREARARKMPRVASNVNGSPSIEAWQRAIQSAWMAWPAQTVRRGERCEGGRVWETKPRSHWSGEDSSLTLCTSRNTAVSQLKNVRATEQDQKR